MNRSIATAVGRWSATLGALVVLFVALGVLESGIEAVQDGGVEGLSRTWTLEGEAWSAILIRLVASLKLYGVVLIAVGGFGIPLGVLAGRARSTCLQRGYVFCFLVLVAIPPIGLAFAGIYCAVEMLEVPVLRTVAAGREDPGVGAVEGFLGELWFVLLPAGVLAISGVGKVAGAVRAAVSESMRCQSMIALAARGLSRSRRLYRYALPASWWAAVQGIADVFPRMLGASILVEWLFDYPGLGARSFEAILEGDTRLLVLLAMVMAILVVIWRLILEVVEAWASSEQGGAET